MVQPVPAEANVSVANVKARSAGRSQNRYRPGIDFAGGMLKRNLLLAGLLLAGAGGPATAQMEHKPMPGQPAGQAMAAPGPDARTLAQLPPEAVAVLREEMRDMQAALTEVLGQLSEGKWEAAADTLEGHVGRGSMGRHRGGVMPGRHMPLEMHRLAMGMHFAASEASVQIRTKDAVKALGAVQRVWASCADCHNTYRVR